MSKKKYMFIFLLALTILFLIKNTKFYYFNEEKTINVGDTAYKIGDVNTDGRINSTDYVYVRRYIMKTFSLTSNQKKYADLNNDGKISAQDYVLIRKIIMGEQVAPTVVPTIVPTVPPTPVPTPVPTAPPTPVPTPVPTAPPTPVPTPVPYVIADDPKFNSYSTIASCSTDKIKYKIIDYHRQYMVLVWVEDANSQLGSALASSTGIGSTSAESLLSREISSYGYSNKCMVAVNASFFFMSTGEIRAGVLINKGRIVVDDPAGARCMIGVNKNGILKQYSDNDNGRALINDGVKNNFRVSGVAYGNDTESSDNRTQICQLDKNNFVLASASGTIGGVANSMYTLTGCKNSWNLDGGGSRKLYYKGKNTSTMTRLFGGDREIPDMLYFVG